MFTVVIPTIGRSTLNHAIDSVLAEDLPCLVINDGVDMTPPAPRPGLTYFKLGRNFGRLDGKLWYGQIALTAGVFLSPTEFTMGIGDDDELVAGSGDLMRSAILADPTIDIWVPAIQYNHGLTVCNAQGVLACGNVSHLIYRSKIFASEPMYHHPLDAQNASDWFHVERCVNSGWKINWIGHTCVQIRPKLPGTHGAGADA